MGDKIPLGAAMNKDLTIKTGQTHVQAYTKPILAKIVAGDIDPSFVVTHPASLEDAPRKRFRDKRMVLSKSFCGLVIRPEGRTRPRWPIEVFEQSRRANAFASTGDCAIERPARRRRIRPIRHIRGHVKGSWVMNCSKQQTKAGWYFTKTPIAGQAR
jgi:hypothetical protein